MSSLDKDIASKLQKFKNIHKLKYMEQNSPWMLILTQTVYLSGEIISTASTKKRFYFIFIFIRHRQIPCVRGWGRWKNGRWNLPKPLLGAPSWLLLAPSWLLGAPSWLPGAPNWQLGAPNWHLGAPSWLLGRPYVFPPKWEKPSFLRLILPIYIYRLNFYLYHH